MLENNAPFPSIFQGIHWVENSQRIFQKLKLRRDVNAFTGLRGMQFEN